MSRYWRDPDSGSVFQYRGDPDKNEVIVIPVEKWRRLVAIASPQVAAHAPMYLAAEFHEIIAEVDRG